MSANGSRTRPSVPAVRARGLRVTYHTGHVALHDVDLVVHQGECLALAGESGSGKTTLAHSLAGLLPPDAELSGTLELFGQPVGPHRKRSDRRLIGCVFQDPQTALNPAFRIGSQVADALRFSSDQLSRGAARRLVGQQLEFVSLDGSLADAYPHELSGGMQQRVVIAMALAGRPKLLIADEPTSQLDATVQRDVLRVLNDVRARLELTMVVVSHDLEVLTFMAERGCIMRNGEIIESGPMAQLIEAPNHPYTRSLVVLSDRARLPNGRYDTTGQSNTSITSEAAGRREA
jgi:ABC-type dipeptide/oligopeptide/nickel transport system ATPase component